MVISHYFTTDEQVKYSYNIYIKGETTYFFIQNTIESYKYFDIKMGRRE